MAKDIQIIELIRNLTVYSFTGPCRNPLGDRHTGRPVSFNMAAPLLPLTLGTGSLLKLKNRKNGMEALQLIMITDFINYDLAYVHHFSFSVFSLGFRKGRLAKVSP